MKKTFFTWAFLLIISPFLLFGENPNLPTGYKDIKIGLSVEQVKSLLEKNSIFGYRGERDVSLLPTQERILIETEGDSFFRRCWFQFYEDKLYSIILNINPDMMDYYSMFKTFTNKYGEPDSLNPEKSEWKNDQVSLSLEKPLTVKYLDVQAFNKMQDSSEKAKSTDAYLREKFLQSF